MTTLSVENIEDVASIRIIDGPDHGSLTVNPDNTMALVLSMENDFRGTLNISYEVTYNNGSAEVFNDTVSVARSTQDLGWGDGTFYMLETDANDDVIVETGDNHRKIYVSGDSDALSINDIAALEGISASDITGRWLAENPEYGANPDMALDSQAGMRLWYALTGEGTAPASHWLMFERGYEYNNLGRVIDSGTMGESALHPLHITAWGEGDKPVLNETIRTFQRDSENIVFSDLQITKGFTTLGGQNMLLHSVDVSNTADDAHTGMGINVRGVDGFTLHNSTVTDTYRVNPDNPNDTVWRVEHTSGIHVSENDGVLIEGVLFDQNGFAPDWRSDKSTQGGQAPTQFSHNLYVQDNVDDFTLRDSIVMRGASIGAKIRTGGHIEDNVFIETNIGASLLGGVPSDQDGIRTGNFTLATDNVVTSASHKELDDQSNGALSRGLDIAGMDSILLDNIVAHLADPDNPAEQRERTTVQQSVNHFRDTPYYDDTTVFNWDNNRNVAGLDTEILNATTIQNFTQQLLGDPNATIADLADFLRAQGAGELDGVVDADLIIAFFQAGFGLSVADRITPETLRFVPNDLGDGIRWDNRLNWSTEDLPGTIAGDSVDLGGNWVSYGGTVTLNNLDFGDGGTLNVTNGKLTVEGALRVGDSGATLNTSDAGQVWIDGGSDADSLTVNVDGGRFANTGTFSGGMDMTVSDGQAILATDDAAFALRDGSSLTVLGDEGKTGFDGTGGGTAVLLLEDGSTLRFDADDGDLGTIEEFRSGAFGDNPNVASGVNLGDATLELDLAGWTGRSEVLIDVDDIIGTFSDLNITGLGNRDAELVINYTNDTVTLNVSAGSGQSDITTVGNQNNAQDNILNALNTPFDDLG